MGLRSNHFSRRYSLQPIFVGAGRPDPGATDFCRRARNRPVPHWPRRILHSHYRLPVQSSPLSRHGYYRNSREGNQPAKSVFDQLIGQSGLFREFVFNAYGNRLTDLLTLVEEVVFTRLDIRLARKLLDLGKHAQIIHITHQTLATELGSAREVISRALKEFALRGWIRRGSGQIEIIQMQGLQQLANSEFVSSR
jgi:cAMP-binding proteins - catabolite gene activator and regulatory subunit of cAMP-dependent protein kinases